MEKHSVIEAFFEPEVEDWIVSLWRRLEREGVGQSLLKHDARPHLTLTSSVDLIPSRLSNIFDHDAVRAIVGKQVNLNHIGVFVGSSNVLFLGLAATTFLQEGTEYLNSKLVANGVDVPSLSRSGEMVYHATLAVGLTFSELCAAQKLVQECFKPRRAGISNVALVDYSPAKVRTKVK